MSNIQNHVLHCSPWLTCSFSNFSLIHTTTGYDGHRMMPKNAEIRTSESSNWFWKMAFSAGIMAPFSQGIRLMWMKNRSNVLWKMGHIHYTRREISMRVVLVRVVVHIYICLPQRLNCCHANFVLVTFWEAGHHYANRSGGIHPKVSESLEIDESLQ